MLCVQKKKVWDGIVFWEVESPSRYAAACYS